MFITKRNFVTIAHIVNFKHFVEKIFFVIFGKLLILHTEKMALKDLYKVVGQRIKDYRELHEWTQAYVSERTEINRATISNIEAGKQQVSLQFLYLIAKALETEISTFLPTLKELNITAEETSAILNEKLDEHGDDAIKNTILEALNKKPENDQ